MASAAIVVLLLGCVGVSLQYPRNDISLEDYMRYMSRSDQPYDIAKQVLDLIRAGGEARLAGPQHGYGSQNFKVNNWQNEPIENDDLPETYESYTEEDGGGDPCTDTLTVVDGWPKEDLKLGEIGGVAVGKDEHPAIFHRADRVWEDSTFFPNNSFAKVAEGPIADPVLIKLNKTDGTVLEQWGDALFHMPHGLSICSEGYYWMTDVAMHQVFKFKEGSNEPIMTLGKAFEPAQDNQDTERFCKPTDVAVSSEGDIYVADGYCNSRVVKFDKDGNFQQILGEGKFWLPHSLALAENLGLLCVADRENMTIHCIDLEGKGNDVIFSDEMLGLVYALSYVPEEGRLYAVMGQTGDIEAEGLTIDLGENESCASDLLGTWSPYNQKFSAPHDVSASPSGDAVYVGEIGPNYIWKFTRE